MELQITQLGINDMDAYSIMWYGNYLKWFKRYLYTYIGSNIKFQFQYIKFINSVKWGDNIVIVGNRIDVNILLLEMKHNNLNVNEALIHVDKGNLSLFKINNSILIKRIVNKLKSNNIFFLNNNSHDYYKSEFTIWKDMLIDNKIQDTHVLDIFEQSRTRLIGGHKILQKMRYDDNQFIFVSNINHFTNNDNYNINLSDKINAYVYIIKNIGWKIFEFKQVIINDKYKECCSMLCKLVIYKDTYHYKGLYSLPEYVISNITENTNI